MDAERILKELDSGVWSDELKDLFADAVYESNERILRKLREEERLEKEKNKKESKSR